MKCRRLLVLLTLCALPASGAETWAPTPLPVTDGLAWWIDAAAQPDAWRAHTRRMLAPEQKVDVVYDGSGAGRHSVQPVGAAQPRWRGSEGAAVLVFDGEDDFLETQLPADTLWQGFTVFLVAAPESNAGGFRGFICGHQSGRNDYETGFNIDLDGAATPAWTALNVEGRGFKGARDLMEEDQPWGNPRLIEVRADPERREITVLVEGRRVGSREWEPQPLRVEELKLGARNFSNVPGPTAAGGFLHGTVAEAVVYGRALRDAEASQVRLHLQKKHAGLAAALSASGRGHLLQLEKDPPPVKMLVPGFTVRELPLDLTNINNLKYRPDGRLVAIAYNGDIHLLSDTDGDGLEDRAELFFAGKGRIAGPVGIDLTADGHGVFVPSRGKVSLILDHDHDGRADEEKVIAEGWPAARGGVDITGIARDPRDGAVYFGLGVRWYDNAYELDEQGVAHYGLDDARGGIQRIAPDFSRREKICTGIRFPIALRFNEEGDLFCTEQEGATWLPNGNPFDELLHIVPGRHYGFPPRHPRHLPGVIDEPSVHDYSPQHQSTCGMNFNLGVNGGPPWGPEWWRGDALVAGESRGKIWRTALAKTEYGYVADTQLLACLQMLTVDLCLSPAGDLVVCCHSGPPDWGTGPEGKGRIFKISRTEERPLPVQTWMEAPGRVVVEFDRPLEPEAARQWSGAARIESGPWVRAGDRFETLRPPYEVVQRMLAEPRFEVPVHSLQLSPDFRRLIVQADPRQDAAEHFALTLPDYDVDYDAGGVEVEWRSADGEEREVGWAPLLDLAAAARFRPTPAAGRLASPAAREGTLTLRTQLDLAHMLQPAVQPGATLDFEYPGEKVTVYFSSRGQPFSVRHGGTTHASRLGQVSHDCTLQVAVPPQQKTGGRMAPMRRHLEPVEITLRLKAGETPQFTAAWHTDLDDRLRPFPPRRHLMPFARTEGAASAAAAGTEIPAKIQGGDWARGREIFFSEEAQCGKCHQVRGHGIALGPDLSNFVHRDLAGTHRDISEPGATLNPDFLAFEVEKTDGTRLVGVPRRLPDGSWSLGIGAGAFLPVAAAEVRAMKPLPVSLMPAGLDKVLGEEKMRDLLTFLLVEPPLMGEYAPLPVDGVSRAPRRRTAEEIAAITAGAPQPSADTRPLRVVLCAGQKDHGVGEHDYPRWQQAWGRLLATAEKTAIETAWEWPLPEQWERADCVVFFRKGDWSLGRARDVDAHLRRGRGLVYIHWAVEGGAGAPELARRIGLASGATGGQPIMFRHGPLDLHFVGRSQHPIIRNFQRLHLHDESYWKMTGDPGRITVLATGEEEGEPVPLFWTAEPEITGAGSGGDGAAGRVFVSIPGHYSWTFDDPLFRALIFRGIAWTSREPVDRFNSLLEAGLEPAPAGE